MLRAVVLVALAAVPARAETWRMRAAIDNDAFTSVIPPLDDQGFTNDLALAVARADGDLAFGGAIFHRMVTSRTSRDRWDQLDLVATAERRWPHALVTTAWLGPTFGGNLGGRAIQNGWHTWSGTGPTLDEGLQNHYAGGRRAAALAGARAAIEYGTRVRPYAAALGQVALGSTGVTHAELAGGARVLQDLGRVTLGAHGELAAAAYHVTDPGLTLPGGYENGLALEWRLGVDVAWSRYRISYEYRANEGGSGEPIGVIAFELTAW